MGGADVPAGVIEDTENLKAQIDHYKELISSAKRHNTVLNELLHEKNKRVMELNQKIEYLLQEQKYEILELIKSEEDIARVREKITESSGGHSDLNDSPGRSVTE
ncbi:hypothetical protein JXC34_01715 [Candidatus Woesearchaeota archaeon]|nr:hypothetical protein [Candidatus Woesearchaeota archaeon]